jgi:hypothetical protein
MEALDLKKFGWTRNHENFTILAITSYKGEDVVVYRNQQGGAVAIVTVDEFCRDFQATYEVTS